MGTSTEVEDLLRELAPQVLGALVRRHGAFEDAEDAVQEALTEAATTWPERGMPDHPRAWLLTVASRRLVDAWRSASARRAREEAVSEETVALAVGSAEGRAETAEQQGTGGAHPLDDSLELLLLCCHPALTGASQVALTLRAVGGLTTAEIARAFVVPEATIAQRISRAKSSIRAAGARFELPDPADLPARVEAVAAVLYVVFTEGHTATAGSDLHRVDLTAEAIRLARLLHARARADPGLRVVSGETAGLLALMLLTAARRPARLDAAGALVPLDEQDRRQWDTALISEGVELVSAALATEVVGAYQLQAAIAAVHAEAASAEETDWRQILGLYELLREVAPGPMVTLNRIVALAMAAGERVALVELDVTAADPTLAGHFRVHAVRAHLLERIGDTGPARAEYAEAARLTLSVPERAYLERRAAALAGEVPGVMTRPGQQRPGQ